MTNQRFNGFLKASLINNKKLLFLVVHDFFGLKGVLFARIKVVNLKSQFSTETLEVLTELKD